MGTRPLQSSDNRQNRGFFMKRVVCKDEWMSLGISSCVETIIQSVDNEFGSKAELFIPIVVRMDRREGAEFKATKCAGVYVFIHEDGTCLKVGKSHLNASKRALEHCRDNTNSKDGTIRMADLRHSDKTHILVFALQGKSLHWVLALENYLENTLNPRIPSHRNG
jgi:hypothetical protein